MKKKSKEREKRKRSEDKKKRRRIREARRRGNLRQSAIILRQKQDEAREARRITRELNSPFSFGALARDLGIPNTDKTKLE